MLKNLMTNLHAPCDPAGLGIARFFFGLLMVIDIFDERGLTYLPEKWGDPTSCHFPLLDSLPRLSLEYMHIVYLVLLVASVGIMIGFLYRLCCLAFVLSYWYIFLMDKTVWNNHSYLYGLLSILLLLTNTNYYWSVDGLLWPTIRNKKVPFWNYGIFRFQVFILYFYAGIKKLDHDWVTGYSMPGLSRQWVFDPFRLFLSNEMIGFLIVHCGGLTFDLSQGFLLLFDKTRILGFILGYSFHGMNAVMFSIGMFSYMCMALMPIFCRPDWPKTIVKKMPNVLQLFLPSISEPQKSSWCSDESVVGTEDQDNGKPGSDEVKEWSMNPRQVLLIFIVSCYVAVQLVLPYSHFVTKGYNSWTNGLYGYSWDMMVHSWDTQHVVVKVVDKTTNAKQYLRPGAFIPMGNNRNRIFSHPDMMKQYALCLADRLKDMEDLNIAEPQIYMDVWKSLNDRYQQRMVDPRVDLVAAPWSPFTNTPWLRPLLVELTPWRSTLANIRSINSKYNNATDIVFVADFPGLFLENYIAPEIVANVTVLSGDIIVQIKTQNVSVSTNETLPLPSDDTHIIYTVTEKPSCYMYVYFNTTWTEHSEEDLIKNDPVLQMKMASMKEWEQKSVGDKLMTFLSKKFANYQQGFWQLYFAVAVILDINVDENDGLYDEL